MFDLREEQERVILVGVQENGGANAEESLDELAELASTPGAESSTWLNRGRGGNGPAPPVRRWRAAWCRCGRPFIRERTSEKEN